MFYFLLFVVLLILWLWFSRSEGFYVYGHQNPQINIAEVARANPGCAVLMPEYRDKVNEVSVIAYETLSGPGRRSGARDYFYIYAHNMITDRLLIYSPGYIQCSIYCVYCDSSLRVSDFYDVYSETPEAFDANPGKYGKIAEVTGTGTTEVLLNNEPRRIVVVFTQKI